MKIKCKAFGRGKNASDCREKCGRLSFVADDEVDAVQLAALYQAWLHGDEGDVIATFRRDALVEYCQKNNVSIVKE